MRLLSAWVILVLALAGARWRGRTAERRRKLRSPSTKASMRGRMLSRSTTSTRRPSRRPRVPWMSSGSWTTSSTISMRSRITSASPIRRVRKRQRCCGARATWIAAIVRIPRIPGSSEWGALSAQFKQFADAYGTPGRLNPPRPVPTAERQRAGHASVGARTERQAGQEGVRQVAVPGQVRAEGGARRGQAQLRCLHKRRQRFARPREGRTSGSGPGGRGPQYSHGPRPARFESVPVDDRAVCVARD